MEPQLRVIAHGAGSIEWRVEVPIFTTQSALRDLLRALLLTVVVSARRRAPAASDFACLVVAQPAPAGFPGRTSDHCSLCLSNLYARLARTPQNAPCVPAWWPPFPSRQRRAVPPAPPPAASCPAGCRLAALSAASAGRGMLAGGGPRHAGGAVRVSHVHPAAWRAAGQPAAQQAVERRAVHPTAPAAGHHHSRGRGGGGQGAHVGAAHACTLAGRQVGWQAGCCRLAGWLAGWQGRRCACVPGAPGTWLNLFGPTQLLRAAT